MTANSAVEFLIWLLIAASAIAVVASRLRIPYTVALVLGGLALGSVHLPIIETLMQHQPDWLTPNIVLVIFLPAPLFEGSLKLKIRHLQDNALPILLLATVGVRAATLITGFAAHWLLGLPLLVALVFGAVTAATDPISVLSIFRAMVVPKRLSIIVEGERGLNFYPGGTLTHCSCQPSLDAHFPGVISHMAVSGQLHQTSSAVSERSQRRERFVPESLRTMCDR